MTTRNAIAAMLVLLVTASLALAADPYFKSGAPAPSAKPAPAPAATTATPPPAPAPTEGAPAKDGKAPPTTKTTPAPAATTASSTFLGQPGEIGAWDTHGNPITKPAFLTSPDADKVRAVVKGMNPVFETRYKGDVNAMRFRLREMRSAICKAFELDEKTNDWDLIKYAAKQYKDARQAMDTLYIWNFILSLALVAMAIWCGNLQKNKLGRPVSLFPATKAGADTDKRDDV